MESGRAVQGVRRPRFRRAPEPPAFRLTDDDVEIVRQVARHRMIRSTHIAALVGRSLDRTNDRLLRLFHAGYLDRPRAQLDRFPTAGTAPMVYALADRGAHLLCERDGAFCVAAEWGRKNREAGRPFIEHQIEIVNFQVALQRAVREHGDISLLIGDDTLAAQRQRGRRVRSPFALRAKLPWRGKAGDLAVVPDFVFALRLAGGARRNFMVEIDRGTMPVRRADATRTSFEAKMRVYLAAQAAKQHEQQFGWKSFRVLTVTTDAHRAHAMAETARQLQAPRSAASLFLFATFGDLAAGDPLAHGWTGADGRTARLA